MILTLVDRLHIICTGDPYTVFNPYMFLHERSVHRALSIHVSPLIIRTLWVVRTYVTAIDLHPVDREEIDLSDVWKATISQRWTVKLSYTSNHRHILHFRGSASYLIIALRWCTCFSIALRV